MSLELWQLTMNLLAPIWKMGVLMFCQASVHYRKLEKCRTTAKHTEVYKQIKRCGCRALSWIVAIACAPWCLCEGGYLNIFANAFISCALAASFFVCHCARSFRKLGSSELPAIIASISVLACKHLLFFVQSEGYRVHKKTSTTRRVMEVTHEWMACEPVLQPEKYWRDNLHL